MPVTLRLEMGIAFMASAASFLQDLRRYGPERPLTPSVSLEEARAYCAHLTASHYENFSVVTWLTPKSLRPAFASVYAFCRWSDDLGDELGDPAQSTRLLQWWRSQLEGLYQGEASQHPVMISLAETIEQFAIPIGPFLNLISAFEQDQVVNDYDTYDQLADYCSRSANPVGQLVLYLGRSYDPENAALSDLTCTGLQLANFWQDVARDHAIGRVYLPRDDRERFNCTDSDLEALRFTPQFRDLLKFEVDRARFLLQEGRTLISKLPPLLALDVDLFNRGGLAILDRIAKQNYDVLSSRPALSKWEKSRLIGGALRASLSRRISPSK